MGLAEQHVERFAHVSRMGDLSNVFDTELYSQSLLDFYNAYPESDKPVVLSGLKYAAVYAYRAHVLRFSGRYAPGGPREFELAKIDKQYMAISVQAAKKSDPSYDWKNPEATPLAEAYRTSFYEAIRMMSAEEIENVITTIQAQETPIIQSQ